MATPQTTPYRSARPRRCAALSAVLAALSFGNGTYAAAIDCPERDAPYSVDLPLMDFLAKPEAVAIAEREMPALLKKIPPMFKNTQAPSLSALMTLRGVTDMLRMPLDEEAAERLDEALATLPVSDEDKAARCARYDTTVPALELPKAERQILVFDKINGFDHGPAVDAATAAIKALGADLNWGVTVTDKGGVFNADSLAHFDLVVWNNNSGDVLTLSQREAFRNYMEQGGGFMGLHGAGGDFVYFWDWYVTELIGAQFIGHTMAPHFQDATLATEQPASGVGAQLPATWTLHDEWYSFRESPRQSGASVVATLDETSYKPAMGGLSLAMGDDHPIAWTRCVGAGRSFYSGIGHRPEVYDTAEVKRLLRNAMTWAAGDRGTGCKP